MLVRRRLVHAYGEPKIADLDGAAFAADEDVFGLDVPVDDVGVVHLLGSREQLPHDGAHDRLGWRRHPSAAALVEEVVEARTDTLHDEAEVHGGRVAGDAVEADDERVVTAARLE